MRLVTAAIESTPSKSTPRQLLAIEELIASSYFEDEGDDEYNPSPIKQPRPPITKPASTFETGPWADDEEERFREALELFGRSWKEIAAHVRTRSNDNIRSHAQKHFVKLSKRGLPLPLKVAESGAGFTLSGKALDPDSATARAIASPASYRDELRRRRRVKEEVDDGQSKRHRGTVDFQKMVQSGNVPSGPDHLYYASTSARHGPESTVRAYIDPDTIEFVVVGEAEQRFSSPSGFARWAVNTQRALLGKPARPAFNGWTSVGLLKGSVPLADFRLPPTRTPLDLIAATAADAIPALLEPEEQPEGRTQYSSSRLRKPRVSAFVGEDGMNASQPLTILDPMLYPLNTQPFSITVHSAATTVIDFHAHMASVEVIGFLGGSWDGSNRSLVIKEAFPCKSLVTNTDDTAVFNVEMDPASEMEARETIRQRNLRVVGWYHSHPVFDTKPSIRDLENQSNYQRLFRDEGSDLDPFVGAIVGPYDVCLPSAISPLSWFHRGNLPSYPDAPMALSVEEVDDGVPDDVLLNLIHLVDEYASYPKRADLFGVWRMRLDGSQYVSVSCIEKMKESVGSRMGAKELFSVLDVLESRLRRRW